MSLSDKTAYLEMSPAILHLTQYIIRVITIIASVYILSQVITHVTSKLMLQLEASQKKKKRSSHRVT